MRKVILYTDPEDGGWIASVPSLPGCHSEGTTRDEALTNVRDAIEDWLEMARMHGDAIPQESLEVVEVEAA